MIENGGVTDLQDFSNVLDACPCALLFQNVELGKAVPEERERDFMRLRKRSDFLLKRERERERRKKMNDKGWEAMDE